ncbi:hypothetical protein ACOSQ3_015071 [Xanthoceras sorbifolium]
MSLVEPERPVALMNAELQVLGQQKLALCLAGRLLATKKVNREAFRAIIPKIWRTIQEIGVVREIDTVVGNCLGKYIRVRVVIDITKPLQHFLKVNMGGSGKAVVMLLRYELLPEYYFECGFIGHSVKEYMCGNGSNGGGRDEYSDTGYEDERVEVVALLNAERCEGKAGRLFISTLDDNALYVFVAKESTRVQGIRKLQNSDSVGSSEVVLESLLRAREADMVRRARERLDEDSIMAPDGVGGKQIGSDLSEEVVAPEKIRRTDTEIIIKLSVLRSVLMVINTGGLRGFIVIRRGLSGFTNGIFFKGCIGSVFTWYNKHDGTDGIQEKLDRCVGALLASGGHPSLHFYLRTKVEEQFLARVFLHEEVRLALFQMAPSKTLGVDGFNAVMIPKVEKTVKMGNFCPINLCNIIYKIVVKAMLQRMGFPPALEEFAVGDPLSPYLFIICAKGLSRLICAAENGSLFSGLHYDGIKGELWFPNAFVKEFHRACASFSWGSSANARKWRIRRGSSVLVYQDIWLPHPSTFKIKVFLWCASLNWIPTLVNLEVKRVPVEAYCSLKLSSKSQAVEGMPTQAGRGRTNLGMPPQSWSQGWLGLSSP